MGIFFAAICSKTQEEFLPAQGSNAQRIVNGLKLCTKKFVHTLITVGPYKLTVFHNRTLMHTFCTYL